MTKRRRRQSRRGGREQQPAADLDRYFHRAENMIDRGRPEEAIQLLEPLLESYAHVSNVHSYLGYAYAETGRAWDALGAYEKAMRLSHDPGLWLPLAALYGELGFRAHALNAFRQVLRHPPEDVPVDGIRQVIAALEEDIQEVIDYAKRPASRVEKGLRFMEEGQRALADNDYAASIAANRRAIRVLGDWPPPHNNLSLALFVDGQPEAAIETARRTIDHDPDNVQALSNAIRYLAWTGREVEAAPLWERLRAIVPENEDARLKIAEAAAVMEDDERVYELLKPLEDMEGVRPDIPGLGQRMKFFLAVAEANLGKRSARRRFKELAATRQGVNEWLAAFKAGRPGPGWAERFPYFHSTEMVPSGQLEEFVDLVGREDDLPPEAFKKEIARFVARFPQLVHMAEKLIWEDEQVEVGLGFLAAIDTPAAHAALRRFGLSQAGDDEDRMRALYDLSQAGQISPDEVLRIWHDGKWREIQMRQYQVAESEGLAYDDEVVTLMNEGLAALREEDHDRAERVLQRAVELEPQAKEAYNNLASVYARRGDHDRAAEMYQAALDIDPLYVFPRCNLALRCLRQDDVDGAVEMLKPLADRTGFQPQEMAFYAYTQARIFVANDEFDEARDALKMALQLWPDYELAQDLLDRLDLIALTSKALDGWREQQYRRDWAWRARLQEKLSTPDPTLSEALPHYTKEVLTGMARSVVRWGGWSALRKAELIERIVEELTDPDNVDWLAGSLADEERDALRRVLLAGGSMPWEDFDAAFDNDLDESRYWQWHEPETVMGRLRMCGLLVEAKVDGALLIAIPADLRPPLAQVLG